MKDVSIIIVNYNTRDLISACVQSIVDNTHGVSYEIIVSDNGSTDGSVEVFGNDPRLIFVGNGENLGFGRANNAGLAHASGRNVLFLNSDTLLRGDAVSILSQYLDANPDVGACGGNLFTREGRPNNSYALHRPGVRTELARFLELKPEDFNTSGKPRKVGAVSGADLMVRKTVLDLVGAFDERFFLFFEETELCHRIDEAGYSIMSVPEAEITHFGGATVRSEQKEGIFQQSRKLYYSLTHSAFGTGLSNAVWAATVYTRIAANCLNPQKRQKWLDRRKML